MHWFIDKWLGRIIYMLRYKINFNQRYNIIIYFLLILVYNLSFILLIFQ